MADKLNDLAGRMGKAPKVKYIYFLNRLTIKISRISEGAIHTVDHNPTVTVLFFHRLTVNFFY